MVAPVRLLGVFAMDVLLSAPILFFGLGVLIALAGSRLPFPDGFGKALAAFLLVAIGLKGGAALSGASIASVLPLLLTAALISFAMPVLGFALLRGPVGLDRVNAAAIAAHYGSVSLVTFVTATKLLEAQGIGFGGHMVAALAVMEGPAIITGLVLAGRVGVAARAGGVQGDGTLALSMGDGNLGPAFREAALNGSILLLAGALVVGVIIGPPGMAKLSGLFVAPWDGALCLFLLDMGHLAASRLRQAAALSLRLVGFGLVMPLLGAAIGVAAALALGLGLGDMVLMVTLCASASYIAVPAALRHALPDADPGLSLPLSLAVTFPFNILVGVPLYLAVCRHLIGS